MQQSFVRLGLTMAAVSLALLSGCGEPAPKMAEVEAIVRIDGKPAEGIYVEFAPDPAKGARGPVSTGITDKAGRFQLQTHKNENGAVVGWHRVALTDTKAQQASQAQISAGRTGTSRVPDRFAVASSSELQKQVTEGKNEIVIEIPSR